MKKRSKAFRQYEAIIEAMDIEDTTEVEIQALEDEMANSDEISNSEYCLLICQLGDKFYGRR